MPDTSPEFQHLQKRIELLEIAVAAISGILFGVLITSLVWYFDPFGSM